MTSRLVGCLTATTLAAFEEQVRQAPTNLLEHRVDYSLDPRLLMVDYRQYGKQFIATLRHQKQGGRFEGGFEDQINVLSSLVKQGPTFLDVEVTIPDELRTKVIHEAHQTKVEVILSYHNFFETPPPKELERLCQEMEGSGCDLTKIVCKAHTYSDCQRLLECQLKSDKLICFAMGQLGSFTRVVSLLYGAPLAYVALGEAVAPGQLSYESFKQIYEALQ